MVEHDLKYCPKCRDEYRPDAELCATCALPLVMGAELIALGTGSRPGRQGALTSHDRLVVISLAPLAEIKRLQALLEGEQIATLLNKEGDGCGCAAKFQLLVREEEAHEAQQILAEEHHRATALAGHQSVHAGAVFNPEAAEAVCPACGFVFATSSTTCPDCGLCFG